MKDISAKRYGRLTAVSLAETKKYRSTRNTQTKAYWLCLCECGNAKVVRAEHLISGRTVSCGCAARDNATTHGNSRRAGQTPEYRAWLNMKARVRMSDELHKKYYVGITIDRRWHRFENFLEDMGKKPTPRHELDRVDNNGGYEPSNCRWATKSENMKNTRRAVKYKEQTS